VGSTGLVQWDENKQNEDAIGSKPTIFKSDVKFLPVSGYRPLGVFTGSGLGSAGYSTKARKLE